MKIANFDFSVDNSVFIIAELSANHNGSLQNALETIKAAKRAGANAIKLQTYTADSLTIQSEKDDFVIKSNSLWDGMTYYDLYQTAYTPWEWHEELFKCAEDHEMICFSSPFDKAAVDFLEKLDVPAYKIASFEITDIPLIKYVASKGKPVILSTGVATYEDIQLAIDACTSVGNLNICLLKCTSSYPAPIEEANLVMISEFEERFKVIPGLSDHTMGSTVPIVAASLGARIIEKHFILDRSLGGPDSSFSMNEKEFTDMVRAIREVEKALGVVSYNLTEKQLEGRAFCRSLYITKDAKKGEVLCEDNLRSIRPGFGLHPRFYDEVIGQKLNGTFEKGTRFSIDMIEKDEI